MKHNTIDKTIKEFKLDIKDFLDGYAEHVKEGEGFGLEQETVINLIGLEAKRWLVQQHTQDIEAFEKVLDNTSFNTRCEQCDTNATNITQILSKLKEVQGDA